MSRNCGPIEENMIERLIAIILVGMDQMLGTKNYIRLRGTNAFDPNAISRDPKQALISYDEKDGNNDGNGKEVA